MPATPQPVEALLLACCLVSGHGGLCQRLHSGDGLGRRVKGHHYRRFVDVLDTATVKLVQRLWVPWKFSIGGIGESGDLCGHEGGRRGPSHPKTADPGSASGNIELSTPQGGTTNKAAKVNSYGSFGLGVELGTWR